MPLVTRPHLVGCVIAVLVVWSINQWPDSVGSWGVLSPIQSTMKLFLVSSLVTSLVSLTTSTILQNGQVRETHFLDTKTASIGTNSTGWKTYGPNATELSYKGRWDSKHISWWAYVHDYFIET